jgi:L-seryl-tRNA(Ser) seleniumtransferase
MLDQSEEVLAARARRLCDGIGRPAELIRTHARAGGGALPISELEGPAVALTTDHDPDQVAARLRASDPPVIVRIHDGRVVFDPRTLDDDEVEIVVRMTREALA